MASLFAVLGVIFSAYFAFVLLGLRFFGFYLIIFSVKYLSLIPLYIPQMFVHGAFRCRPRVQKEEIDFSCRILLESLINIGAKLDKEDKNGNKA